jgi:hypothetical protein
LFDIHDLSRPGTGQLQRSPRAPVAPEYAVERRRRRLRRGYVPATPRVTILILAAALTAVAMGVFVVVPATLASHDAYSYAASSDARLPSICLFAQTPAASPSCIAPAQSRADAV